MAVQHLGHFRFRVGEDGDQSTLTQRRTSHEVIAVGEFRERHRLACADARCLTGGNSQIVREDLHHLAIGADVDNKQAPGAPRGHGEPDTVTDLHGAGRSHGQMDDTLTWLLRPVGDHLLRRSLDAWRTNGRDRCRRSRRRCRVGGCGRFRPGWWRRHGGCRDLLLR